MRLTTKNTIDAPAEMVFDSILNFAGARRDAVPEGARVARTDRLEQPGPGMTWELVFDLLGQRREMHLRLLSCDRPGRMEFKGTSPGLDIECTAQLSSPEAGRTVLALVIDIKPQNLSARILVQSLKLAKYQVSRRIEDKLGGFCRGIEARAKQGTGANQSA
ncbi:SRPBCC family protein [Pseudooceanicola nanhaiensis]|uniref:SRPBCC family protein n=1 Tax=Pseudooceanicola nanhaiensis TaxID=375761 RepID=UPI001CD5A553|nr:SRPBCC family protein [Pseudooceanicola nanhaiensis]MCA0922791.1 SRPBCC family protein [Pseudooceanicola nanhaiensis]